MLLKEVLLQALYALIGHRFRAMMTMLGIAWGIVAVVLLMAYGNGFHTALTVGFQRAFSDGTAVIWNGQTSMQAGGERAGKRVRMKEEDADALRELGLIKYASPEYYQTFPLAYDNRQTSATVRGVAPEYGIMRSETPEAGRFINAEDVEKRRRVVFLGTEVARKLFGNGPVIGQTIRVQSIPFEVIGLMTQKAQLSSYQSPDKYCAFIPYSTFNQSWHRDSVDTLVIQTINPALHERA